MKKKVCGFCEDFSKAAASYRTETWPKFLSKYKINAWKKMAETSSMPQNTAPLAQSLKTVNIWNVNVGEMCAFHGTKH